MVQPPHGRAPTDRRTRATGSRQALLALALVGIALAGPPGVLRAAGAAEESIGEWLLGRWAWGGHSRLEFRRDGEVIRWTMQRARVQSSRPQWGEKTAVQVSGTVSKLSGSSVELTGRYDRSDNRYRSRLMSSGKLEMNEYDFTVPSGLKRTVKSLVVSVPALRSA